MRLLGSSEVEEIKSELGEPSEGHERFQSGAPQVLNSLSDWFVLSWQSRKDEGELLVFLLCTGKVKLRSFPEGPSLGERLLVGGGVMQRTCFARESCVHSAQRRREEVREGGRAQPKATSRLVP